MRWWWLWLVCGCDRLLGLSTVKPFDAPQYPPYTTAVLADSPVGYFRLDETSGVDAIDLIGGASGTYLGNVVLGEPGAFPDSGTSVGFDGTNSAVTLMNRFDFTGTEPFSLEAWINPGGPSGMFYELGSRWKNPPNREGYTWWQNGSGLGFERDISDSQAESVTYESLVLNQWVYVVATYDGATMALYVGGRQVGMMASSLQTPEVGLATLIGGASGDPMAAPFLGDIDEYAIYDHALTPDQISAHFAAATP